MRRNFWIYLALVPVLLMTVVLYDDAIAFFLGLILLVLPLWALIQGALTVPFIRGSFQIPAQMAETGKTVEAVFIFENRSILPAAGGQAEIVVYGTDGRLAARKKVAVHIPARGKTEIRLDFRCEYCGLFTFRGGRFWISDSWGFFGFRGRKTRGGAELAVLPASEPVAMQISNAVRLFWGDAQEFDPGRPGEDVSEVFGVHEYIPGDRLQRTHWKLSARTETLMIKDFSRPLSCPVVILADWKGKEETAQSLDWLVRTVMGLSMGLCHQDCLHEIFWPVEDGQMEKMIIRTEEDCYVWGERLIRQIPRGKTDWAVKAFQYSAREQYRHLFLVSSRFCREMKETAEIFRKEEMQSIFVPSEQEENYGEGTAVYCLPAGKTDEALKELYLEV